MVHAAPAPPVRRRTGAVSSGQMPTLLPGPGPLLRVVSANRRADRARLPTALLAALALAWGATPARAADLRIALGDRTVHALLADAVERGAFGREGLDVEIVETDDAAATVADGDAELAAVTADALLRADAYGVPLRGALLLDYVLDDEALVAAARVRGITGLRGATIAVPPGGSAELLLDFALQRVGLDMDDVTAVALDSDPAAVAAALEGGTLDAAVLTGPALRRVEELMNAGQKAGRGADRAPLIRLASGGDRPGLIADVLAGEEATLARDKDTIKSVVRVWNRTVGRARRDPAGTAAAIAERTGTTPALAARALAGLRLLDVQDNIELMRGEYQSAFSDMSEVLERRDSVFARGVPSANRYLSFAALRQVAAGR